MTNEQIVKQCRDEYENGIIYRQGRANAWKEIEDQYFGRVKKTLKGRFNIPVPVMSGFVDTLMSKLDDYPLLRFLPSEESDFRVSRKLQALWDKTSKKDDFDYDLIDLDGRKLGIMSGRAIFKVFGESHNGFKFNIFNTDHYDFYIDPTAGGDIERARFLGEDNIFKRKSDLLEGADQGIYDKKAVVQVLAGLTESSIKENEDRYKNKASRLNALGMSAMYNFMAEATDRFIESGTVVNGERYYVLWNYATGLAIRCVPLKEMFESGMWQWKSWATHRDTFNFWSKAPADDISPISEAIRLFLNQELDNRQKRNFGQRAYDPKMFDGAELEYRPNGLVAIKAGTTTRQISEGIYEFQTPELNGTINLVNWLDNIAGQKSGVTAATQGQADDVKVGIYQGNMQQVADRLGMYNKSYTKCHKAIGRAFVWACYEHLNKSQAVKIIGENGAEWDSIKGSEINPDMDVSVESSASEMQVNEVKKTRRTNAISAIISNPALVSGVNPQWANEQILLNGEFTDEEVRAALDVENYGNREVLARAAEALEELVAGKTPKIFRGANTAFQQKLLDFAMDNTDDDMALFQRIMAYSESHNDIVMENMQRKAMRQRSQMGMGSIPPSVSGAPAPEAMTPMNAPAPGIPSETTPIA